VNIKTSDGKLDITTNNTTLISRLKLRQTFHAGLVDNGINDTWIGASAVNATGDATCNTNRGNDLNANIFHPCCKANCINWIPIAGERMIVYNDDNVADNIGFGIWVKKIEPPTITSLSELSGCPGSNLIINGTHLGETSVVTIGGAPATIISKTENSVTIKLGNGNSGVVRVTTPSGSATSGQNFTFTIGGPLGSFCNPFTSIDQVTTTIADGSYHFNLNGHVFETKIEGGWVLVANDAGAHVPQNLQETTILNTNSKGILNKSVFSNLGNINTIKVKSSDGRLDIKTTNASLVNRLKQSQTFNQGVVDNAIKDSCTDDK